MRSLFSANSRLSLDRAGNSESGSRRSNPMPITVPNYNRETDRLQFGTLIAITSES
jgi:hypothetical protein